MQIWAVGGGKGGTGKSLVSNGLGIRLAERGCQVILVDADYGGPNQHTYCGLRKPASTLAHFFDRRMPLEEIAMETHIEGLRLIPGNVNSANTDNFNTAQKQKLFRHIKQLRADHVILDLGAGTQYDVLDTFLLADVQVGVVAPDAMSIENFYLFLKNVQYRLLCNVLSWTGLKERAKSVWRDRAEHGISTSRDWIVHLRTLSPEFSEVLNREHARLQPHIVLNQVREYRQVEMGLAVESAVTKLFRIEATYAGHIRYDTDLWQQFGRELPAISHGTASTLHQDLERVTEAILDAKRRQEASL
ncbi:MAG: AAA family ATPase [Holophagaceae bacterium]|uniref:AAA family ATPase n=1 Tax=Candidatus Geothrix skivensis TaxID=2954439 RepID=A0A9D7SI08_9BACT|nr:AAA family ATPase [Candidatus Geothrix skivensis]